MTQHPDHPRDPHDGRTDPGFPSPELLVAYLDGELSAEEALRVAAWLDDHPEALREVEHDRLAWELLEHYEDEPVPADFAQGVFAAVGIQHEPRAGRVVRMAWYRRPLATAAAVLLAVGVTVFVMRDGGTGVPGADDTRIARTSPTRTRTTDVVEVLADVPAEQLGELLLNADVLLSVDAEAVDVDFDDETVLGG